VPASASRVEPLDLEIITYDTACDGCKKPIVAGDLVITTPTSVDIVCTKCENAAVSRTDALRVAF
jgi:hypothetical protein